MEGEEVSKSGPTAVVQVALRANLLDGAISPLLLAGGSVSMYVVLVGILLRITSGDRHFLLNGERDAAQFSAAMLTTACVLRMSGMSISTSTVADRGAGRLGVVILALHTIAAISNGMMATMNVPVLLDPVTGCRVHVLRAAEWAVCAFVMIFVVEAVDARSVTVPLV